MKIFCTLTTIIISKYILISNMHCWELHLDNFKCDILNIKICCTLRFSSQILSYHKQTIHQWKAYLYICIHLNFTKFTVMNWFVGSMVRFIHYFNFINLPIIYGSLLHSTEIQCFIASFMFKCNKNKQRFIRCIYFPFKHSLQSAFLMFKSSSLSKTVQLQLTTTLVPFLLH